MVSQFKISVAKSLKAVYGICVILHYFPELDEYLPGSENAQLLHLLKCLAELTEFILV